jgi:hypothetical protein
MDGDTDHEDGGDDEPSLAAPENNAGSQVVHMRGSDRDGEVKAPETVLPEALAEPQPTAEILPWRGRGNVIAAAGSFLVDLLERALGRQLFRSVRPGSAPARMFRAWR